MNLLKKLFYFLAFIIILLCAGIVYCAFTPSATESLKEKLYGDSGLVEDVSNVINAIDNTADSILGQDTTTVIAPVSDIMVGTQEGINWDNIAGISYEMTGTGLTVPNSVMGRSGLTGVEEKAQEIDASEQALLEQGLSLGESGDSLSFDTEYYPYYGMLTENMKRLYKQIYANLCQVNGNFAPIVEVHTTQLKTVFEAIYCDHPELFWVETGYSCKYSPDGKVVEIIPKYNETASRLDSATRIFEAAADDIISKTRRVSTLEEKEVLVHDLLAEQVEYVTGTAMSQSAYSALVNRASVCAGYARAFQYIMIRMGYPCYYCQGYSDGEHAWNIVKTDAGYRNVDVTWDDASPVSYEYFNKTDSQFKKDHSRSGLSVYLPACTSAQTEEGQVQEEPEKTKPLVYVKNNGKGDQISQEELDRLEEAGFTPDQVTYSMDKYYEACLELMKKAGTGSHTFEVIVPVSLYNSIELAYSDENYKKGYVKEALEAMGATNFAIALQVVRTNGGYYYQLYHNIAVWKE